MVVLLPILLCIGTAADIAISGYVDFVCVLTFAEMTSNMFARQGHLVLDCFLLFGCLGSLFFSGFLIWFVLDDVWANRSAHIQHVHSLMLQSTKAARRALSWLEWKLHDLRAWMYPPPVGEQTPATAYDASAQRLAWAKAQHPRLGLSSRAHCLPWEVAEMVEDHLYLLRKYPSIATASGPDIPS